MRLAALATVSFVLFGETALALSPLPGPNQRSVPPPPAQRYGPPPGRGYPAQSGQTYAIPRGPVNGPPPVAPQPGRQLVAPATAPHFGSPVAPGFTVLPTPPAGMRYVLQPGPGCPPSSERSCAPSVRTQHAPASASPSTSQSLMGRLLHWDARDNRSKTE